MTHKLTLFQKHQRGTLAKSRIYGCYAQEGNKLSIKRDYKITETGIVFKGSRKTQLSIYDTREYPTLGKAELGISVSVMRSGYNKNTPFWIGGDQVYYGSDIKKAWQWVLFETNREQIMPRQVKKLFDERKD